MIFVSPASELSYVFSADNWLTISDNFACGNFVENTIIPDDKVSVNTFSVISDKLQEQLRTIVTAPIEDDEIEPFKNVKRLYLACMNKSRIWDSAIFISEIKLLNSPK